MKRVADIIVDTLVAHGITQTFMVTGGGAMHLNDAFTRHPTMKVLFQHHEQACSIAAESYCRLSGIMSAVNVTTGPGGINALNGVYGAYVDSIAMIVISGQIKRDTCAQNFPLPLRQLGDQEVDIISMARPVTKYALTLQDPVNALELTEKAIYLAGSGRPGPVWLDVPLDVQSAMVDENSLSHWQPTPTALKALRGDPDLAANTLGDFGVATTAARARAIAVILRKLKQAKRPVLLGGTGVRIAHREKEFLALAEALGIPAVGGWNAYDLIPSNHPCYAGRPGTVGDRPGNFTVQNADFLLTLGCRLNIRQTSYNWDAFASNAWKAQVDIDPAELYKPTLHQDLAVHADLADFLPDLLAACQGWQTRSPHAAYRTWCQDRVRRYPVLQERQRTSPSINPYYFMDRLFELLDEDDVIVTANATAAVVSAQTGKLKPGMRLYSNSGDASMGYDLPAAIGAAATGTARRIICLAGDGSIMMNLQELQTIIGNHLPIIIFLLNNNGYLSIRQTQQNYFPDNMAGIDPSTGVTFPNFTNLAKVFGYPGSRMTSHDEFDVMLPQALREAPSFHEIVLDPLQGFEPRLVSRQNPDGSMTSPRLEDMAPFLSHEELADNTIDDTE